MDVVDQRKLPLAPPGALPPLATLFVPVALPPGAFPPFAKLANELLKKPPATALSSSSFSSTGMETVFMFFFMIFLSDCL